MSEVTRRLATNTTMDTLAKDTTVNTLAKDTTLQAIGTSLGTLAAGGSISALADALVDALASVKTVNGKYGVVVLDSGDILITKTNTSGKTVKQILTELQAAVSATPLEFSASQVSGDDYKVTVTTGTPS